ncbi:integral membrane protein [Penicillium sp. IBT 35674x]|nr:integral membrane protein [Penicillium sp. IBT 35674x]
MNGIFPADLAVYLFFLPIVVYIFLKHKWTGFLPWYYLNIFCVARIVGGALGVQGSNALAANIIQSIGISPLLLAVDGLVHEARVYRYPSKSPVLGWSVIIATTSTMGAAMALSIVGALDIYEGTAKPDSYSLWKAGTAMIVAIWVFQLIWSTISIFSRREVTHAPTFQGSTALLQGAIIALLFIGIRVIYVLVAVCTQRRDLSPVYGSTAVRVVLLFLPEVFATLTLITVGLRTRHLREVKQ